MLKKCIYIKKLLFLSVELLLLLLSITFFFVCFVLFLNVRMTWTQLHYLRNLMYLDFIDFPFFSFFFLFSKDETKLASALF